MRIVTDIERSVDGHIQGTVTTEASAAPRPFSGVLELLAVIERCLDAPTAPQVSSSAPATSG